MNTTINSFKRFQLAALAAFVGILTLSAMAPAGEGEIRISIAKDAQLTDGGAIIIKIHIACIPPPGTLDFQEGFAGAFQESTGAESESGIDGAFVCDGIMRMHTAHLFPFEEPFEAGRAVANASVIACYLDDGQQICINDSAARQVLILGTAVR